MLDDQDRLRNCIMRDAAFHFPTPYMTARRARHARLDELEPLAFKVAPDFRRRFRQRALGPDLKLNELLFAALDAWEEKNGIK